MRYLVVLCSLSSAPVNAACQLYPIHPLATIPYQKSLVASERCRAELTHADQDGDGIADWSTSLDHVDGPWLVPLDQDIDGDGVDNILDAKPFDGRAGGTQKGFPSHLLFGPLGLAGGLDPKINSSQLQLWRSTGLIAVNARSWHSVQNLEAIAEVFELIKRGAPRSKISELKYVIADDSILDRGMTGYYSRDLRALIVARPKDLGNSHEQMLELQGQILRTMSHEIGHAFAFSSMSPNDLANIATQMGPWHRQEGMNLVSFFAPQFFKSHWLFSAPMMSLRDFKNIPSRYSLQNIHEWFAECFSSVIIELADRSYGQQDEGLRPVSPALRNWLVNKFQQIGR